MVDAIVVVVLIVAIVAALARYDGYRVGGVKAAAWLARGWQQLRTLVMFIMVEWPAYKRSEIRNDRSRPTWTADSHAAKGNIESVAEPESHGKPMQYGFPGRVAGLEHELILGNCVEVPQKYPVVKLQSGGIVEIYGTSQQRNGQST